MAGIIQHLVKTALQITFYKDKACTMTFKFKLTFQEKKNRLNNEHKI